MQTNTSKNTENGNEGQKTDHTFTHTQTPQVIESQILHFKFKQCPPLQKANENEKHSRHTMLKGNVRRPSMRMKQVNQAVAKWTHQQHLLMWLRVRLRTKHSLMSSSNTKESKKKYPNSECDTSQALGNEMTSVEKVFSISIKGKVPHLWHRQVVTLQSQLTAIPLRESERFPKGNYITVELHKLWERFWYIMQSGVTPSAVLHWVPSSLWAHASMAKSSDRGNRPHGKKYCAGTTTGWKEEHGGAAASDTLKACEVNDGLDEDGVISDVGVLGV